MWCDMVMDVWMMVMMIGIGRLMDVEIEAKTERSCLRI